jgi:ATP-dependent helicase HrpB
VDVLLPEVIATLRRSPNLVIEAPPGAGKTTRVPPALLPLVRGEVIVLEPRRIAARLAAHRVAFEMGEEIGQTVGYQVRFEEVASPHTRLRFLTEGVLTRRFLSDPQLKGVDAVVLDEFHERHLESDLALALLKRLQKSRHDLRLVVMSATLEADPVAQFFGGCPILRSEGRLFDLSIRHQPYSPAPLEVRVKDAVELVVTDSNGGDILTFLPGAAEIRRAMRACESIARRAGLLMLPLHGSLPPKDQDLAVAPASQRKLILATNVAESSITIDGVSTVIDSGLARFAAFSPWSGLPTLHVARISKASAKQRAGRAGRTGAGRVIRLYSEEDYSRRPENDTPEILRSDLSQLCLDLRAMGISDPNEIDWLDSPPEGTVRNAESLLNLLGATGENALRLAKYPLSPRLSRILVESISRGVGEDGCIATALLGSGVQSTKNDLLAAMDAERDYRTQQHIEQLRRIARPPRQKHHDDNALLISVLAGFPDRVARLRSGNQVLLSSGASAEIAGEPPSYEFMVILDAEDRNDKPFPLVRMTARLDPGWLLDLFPNRIHEESRLAWNRTAERVDAVSALYYDDLALQETTGAVPDPQAASAMLVEKALEAGIERFVDPSSLANFQARAEFSGLIPPDISTSLQELCSGLRSFAELRKTAADFISLLEHKIGKRRLDELAPARIRLKNGRETRVHYERGKPPWTASRLQDFFGMKETPRIGPNRTSVVVHLLAPNQRPVQTTSDLAGFWERLYPQVRRELMRRYPKHTWPEKP